jgi:hypothetical protein
MGRKRQSLLRVGEDVKEEVGVTSMGLVKLTVVEKGRRDEGTKGLCELQNGGRGSDRIEWRRGEDMDSLLILLM